MDFYARTLSNKGGGNLRVSLLGYCLNREVEISSFSARTLSNQGGGNMWVFLLGHCLNTKQGGGNL